MNRSFPTLDPWLTVIMPSYRGERWIERSLNSLASERADGVEVLVIDSSPTSASRDIARKYTNQLRLRIFDRCDLPSWQAKTNFGVQAAGSAHVCWLGVDDVWLPGRAAAAREWIDADPNAQLHLAPSAIIDEADRRLGVWRCPLPSGIRLPSGLLTERLVVQNFIAAPAPVFRRDAWLHCGGLDENLWYTADWDMWLKLAASGSATYHDLVTVGFRIHSGSLTVTGSRDFVAFGQQMQIVLERHLGSLEKRSQEIERAARASIAVNAALASASTGKLSGLLRAAAGVASLGPAGIHRYFRDSRIVDRVLPRLRARCLGGFCT